MPYFIELVLTACSCAAQRRLSVSLFSSVFLNHSHFLLSLWHSHSLTYFRCRAFCFHFFNRISLFSLLLVLLMYLSKLDLEATMLIRAFLLCIVCFDRLHFSSSICPQHLPDLFLHHFLVCRVCLHMILGEALNIWR